MVCDSWRSVLVVSRKPWWSLVNIVGSLIALAGLFAQLKLFDVPEDKKGLRLAIYARLAELTNWFLAYVTFYLGLLGLVLLLWDFSLKRLLFAALCAWLGRRGVYAMATLTSPEFHQYYRETLKV